MLSDTTSNSKSSINSSKRSIDGDASNKINNKMYISTSIPATNMSTTATTTVLSPSTNAINKQTLILPPSYYNQDDMCSIDTSFIN